jgi:hypothetical protein
LPDQILQKLRCRSRITGATTHKGGVGSLRQLPRQILPPLLVGRQRTGNRRQHDDSIPGKLAEGSELGEIVREKSRRSLICRTIKRFPEGANRVFVGIFATVLVLVRE